MTREELIALFEKFSTLRTLVVGDVIIDAYLWGKVDRISPEAPVPVVSVLKKEDRPGGAANVAINLRALGAETILCTVTGNDENYARLAELLRLNNLSVEGLVKSDDRITTVKTRVISAHQHMVRIDEEQTNDITPAEEDNLLQRVEEIIVRQKPDVILFEDYNKGVLTKNGITRLIALAQKHGIKTSVDPKKKNFLAYSGVTMFKPNLKELIEGLKLDNKLKTKEQLTDAAALLQEKLRHEISLITLSERGIYVKNGKQETIVPAHIRNIADVSGAGDTVFAVASLCLAAGISLEWMATLANLSGGLVCEHPGVVPINKEELLKEALALIS